MGFVVLGQWVLRADMAERLIAGLGKRGRAGHFAPDTALLAVAGCGKKQFPKLAATLGYSIAGVGEDGQQRYQRTPRPANGKAKKKPRPTRADPNSPFAELGKHALFGTDRQGGDRQGGDRQGRDRQGANKNRAIKSGV